MVKYNIYKGKKKISEMSFTDKEIEHLRKSGYARKKGVRLVKKKK